MRLRSTKVCDQCRKRKLGCDGKKPACSQCLSFNHECSGYQDGLVFVNKVASSMAASRMHAISSSAKPSTLSRSVFPASTLTHNELAGAIVEQWAPSYNDTSQSARNCSRTCGAWVEVLPRLEQPSTHYSILRSAMYAFYLALQRTSENTQYAYVYGTTLRHLRNALQQASAFDAQLVGASMCLALSEVLKPLSVHGWLHHVRGTAHLFQHGGPHLFVNGDLHLLFVGFRPLIILDAVMQASSNFLLTDEWLRVPFVENAPSVMQHLLSIGAALPPLLQRSKRIKPPATKMLINDLSCSFTRILHALQGWEQEMKLDPDNFIDFSAIHFDASFQAIRYKNITIANAMTHCWAFQIVCARELMSLRGLPATSSFVIELSECSLLKIVGDQSYRILQSMPYLTQDSFKMYGISSTFFVMQVAYEALQLGHNKQAICEKLCHRFFDELQAKGLNVREQATVKHTDETIVPVQNLVCSNCLWK